MHSNFSGLYEQRLAQRWGADGKWIYLGGSSRGGVSPCRFRCPVNNGPADAECRVASIVTSVSEPKMLVSENPVSSNHAPPKIC
jgi:hypothetical protein